MKKLPWNVFLTFLVRCDMIVLSKERRFSGEVQKTGGSGILGGTTGSSNDRNA